MKLPFVSRLAFDVLAAQNAALRSDYSDLLARYHMLRLQGHTVPEPPPAPPREPERDPVLQAIADASADDPSGRKYTLMMRQAARDRAAGMDDADIITAIQAGVVLADEGVPI